MPQEHEPKAKNEREPLDVPLVRPSHPREKQERRPHHRMPPVKGLEAIGPEAV